MSSRHGAALVVGRPPNRLPPRVRSLGDARPPAHASRSSRRAAAPPPKGLVRPLRGGVRPAPLGAASRERSVLGRRLSGLLRRSPRVRRRARRARPGGRPDRRLLPIPRLRRGAKRGRDRLVLPGPLALGRGVQRRDEAPHARSRVPLRRARRLPRRAAEPQVPPGGREARCRPRGIPARARPRGRRLSHLALVRRDEAPGA